jgi:DNA-binding CsgD family transcriptional regulator
MVARNDALLVRRSRLQFKDAYANAAFQGFMAKGNRELNGDSLMLRLDRPRLQHPYRVLASLLVRPGRRDGGGLGYCVFIYEPHGGQQPVPVQVLRRLYRLTPAEARLANELFAGRSLAESAQAIGISINTARSVLKRVFTKCAVGSQPEFLLLLSLGPRTL